MTVDTGTIILTIVVAVLACGLLAIAGSRRP